MPFEMHPERLVIDFFLVHVYDGPREQKVAPITFQLLG